MKGQRIRITSIAAPQGRVFDSLRLEYDKGIVGVVDARVEPEGWYAVQFPSSLQPLQVHRSMMEPVRK